MGFRFRVVVQLPGEFPDADAARAVARRIHGETVVRVVSNASDEIAVDEERARGRNRRLRFPELEDEEGGVP